MSTATDRPLGDDVVVEDVSRAGGIARAVAVLVVLVLTLLGTFVGQDHDFPFGPFRMYATRNAPDGVVSSLRLEAVDTTGKRFAVSAGDVGLRRADLEGSLPDLEKDPGLLGEIATRWEKQHPAAAPLARLEVIVRKTRLRDGLETSTYTDVVAAVWVRP